MANRYRICFVCTGNACRSPFAECVTRALLEKDGRTDIEVFSVGTLDWGENPRDAEMAKVAKHMGYEMTGTTIFMTREALLSADKIVVFNSSHRDAITRILDYNYWNRIELFDSLAFGTDSNVEDPHYQTESVYRRVAEHIETGCKHIVEQLKHKL